MYLYSTHLSVSSSVRPSVRLSICLFVLSSYISWVRVRSKVRARVKGQSLNFWCAAVDIRGSALPSAAKSNSHHYQCKVFVSVYVISRHCADAVDWLSITSRISRRGNISGSVRLCVCFCLHASLTYGPKIQHTHQ